MKLFRSLGRSYRASRRRIARASRRERIAWCCTAGVVLAAFGTFLSSSLDGSLPTALGGESTQTETTPQEQADAKQEAEKKKRGKKDGDDESAKTADAGATSEDGGSSKRDKRDTGKGVLRKDPADGAQTTNEGSVVVGVDFQDGPAANSFFRQYQADAGAADPLPQARAVAKWINANGGLGGRGIELRERAFDFFRERLSVKDDATCADFGRAPKVVAAIDRHASVDILIPCLSKKGIPTLVESQAAPAVGHFANNLLFSPGTPAIDRTQGAYVEGLKRQGFFDGKVRVGVLYAKHIPQLDNATTSLRQSLKDRGIGVVEDFGISLEDPVSFFATEKSAVLRFALKQINRVIVVDDNGVAVGQFMRDAESQGLRPRYGLNSISSPMFVAANVPRRQLQGAVGVGWSPLVDVPAHADPGGGGTRALCDRIYAEAGVSQGGRTPFGIYSAQGICSDLLALRAAANASHDLSPAGIRRGLEATAGTFQTGLTMGGGFARGRGDAQAHWRPLRFESDCGCFRYNGPGGSF